MVLDRLAIAAALRLVGDWLLFLGDKGHRARAYQTGATAIEQALDFDERLRQGRLAELRGIGPSLTSQIEELARTGRSAQLDQLRGELPHGLLELPAASGLSPPRILALHRALGVSGYDDLLAAAQRGALRAVKGYSDKTIAKVIAALLRHRQTGEALTLDKADALLDELRTYLASGDADVQIVIAGERRRAADTVNQLELAATHVAPPQLLQRFVDYPRAARTELAEPGRASVRLTAGPRATLLVGPPGHFGGVLVRATGPEAHVERIAGRLAARGRSLDDAFADEAAVYAAAELPWVPPERRDDPGAGLTSERYDDLLQLGDLLGMTHCHTTYSDGRNSIEEMARAAEARGFRYLTITDHSPSAHYAKGVEIDRLRRQWDEIARVQERVAIRLLRGTESDITKEGALDYPDEILVQLDVVIASIHSRHQLDRRAMTDRLVRAMRLPVFKIWGHALGRLLLSREPFACELDEIFDAIATSPAAIELNGDPYRLDLPADLVPQARARQIKFIVSTDAHSVDALGHLHYGVGAARRGGLRRHEVLNTLPVDEFLAAVKPARR